jgi:hypothetical protein
MERSEQASLRQRLLRALLDVLFTDLTQNGAAADSIFLGQRSGEAWTEARIGETFLHSDAQAFTKDEIDALLTFLRDLEEPASSLRVLLLRQQHSESDPLLLESEEWWLQVLFGKSQVQVEHYTEFSSMDLLDNTLNEMTPPEEGTGLILHIAGHGIPLSTDARELSEVRRRIRTSVW